MNDLASDEMHNYLSVDVVQNLAEIRGWNYVRDESDEIQFEREGARCAYQFTVSWIEGVDVLSMSCAFDLHVPPHRIDEIAKFVFMVNQELWVGHFDVWRDAGIILHRQSVLLPAGLELSDEQGEAMVEAAFDICERFYEPYNYIVWAGKTAAEAYEIIAMATEGEA